MKYLQSMRAKLTKIYHMAEGTVAGMLIVSKRVDVR